MTKSILCVKIKYAPRLPLMMRCSQKEVVKMGSKKRLNKRKTGDKIYQAIEKSGLTYEEIAEELGLSSPRVIYEQTSLACAIGKPLCFTECSNGRSARN